jgi:hypothetical protein
LSFCAEPGIDGNAAKAQDYMAGALTMLPGEGIKHLSEGPEPCVCHHAEVFAPAIQTSAFQVGVGGTPKADIHKGTVAALIDGFVVV